MIGIDPDNPDFDPRFLGIHEGPVVDRNDPEKLGRVKVRIPGLVEPATPWAWPVGAPGGGTKDRGFWWIPDEGSEVAVWFKGGDPDQPRYMPAMWGTGEPPEPSGGDPEKIALAFGPYDFVVDRTTKGLLIVDRADPENKIEFDGVTKAIEISSKVGVNIKSTGQVDIQGLVVSINGVPAGTGKL